MVNKIL